MIIALGIDQSLKASGLVLASWNPAGGATPFWWVTVRNLTPRKVFSTVIEIAERLGLDNLDVLALEGSFWSLTTPDQGFSHAETRGMWRQAVHANWPNVKQAPNATARVWRPKYLGPGNWTREVAEKAAVKLAMAHGIDTKLTVHVAEALGILTVGCKYLDSIGGNKDV